MSEVNEGGEEPMVEEETWSQTVTLTPTYGQVGFGVPYNRFGAIGGGTCDDFLSFDVHENVTALQAHLYGLPTNPGTGYMVPSFLDGVQAHHPGPGANVGDYTLYHGEPQTSYWVNVTDPLPGEWSFVAFPHGIVIRQTWTLDLTFEGAGGEVDFSFDETLVSSTCDEDELDPANAASLMGLDPGLDPDEFIGPGHDVLRSIGPWLETTPAEGVACHLNDGRAPDCRMIEMAPAAMPFS